MFVHKPVMVEQVMECLDIQKDDIVIDCTLGEGGHSSYFLRKTEKGLVLGIEQDDVLLGRTTERFRNEGRFIPVKDNFSNLKEILRERVKGQADKIFFDLGVSMYHFKESGRGFSFSREENLDMRLDRSKPLSAQDVVNHFNEKQLSEIIWAYGEERFSNLIAHWIVKERESAPITTSLQLADIIKKAIPRRYWSRNIHPATRTFQAIRIFVNDEILILERALKDGVDILKPDGRICVISFHSLEDRIVKSVFKDLERGCLCPPDFPVCICGGKRQVKMITKKPLVPEDGEKKDNPASRSARLRCAVKLRENLYQNVKQKMKASA